jgi:myosin heavy subunit
MVLFEKGSYVFLPDDTDCYVPARVTATFEQGKPGMVTLLDSNTQVRVVNKLSALLVPMDEQSLKRWDDMVLLKQLDNASLLHNLRLRYAKDEIYTNIGTILISVNPYKQIPDLFGPEMMDRFIGTGGGNLEGLPPHIFGVAEHAYASMLDDNADQSCVITGESGAGKTEATKLFLQYIAERSRRNRPLAAGQAPEEALQLQMAKQSNKNVREFDVPLREQILGANPLMEAFGNAKTVRNNNSSRFGKLIDVHVSRAQGAVVGGTITNYLLEKSRVVRHLEGERSYHVFYQLCAAANQSDLELKSSLRLLDADQFHYLNQSETPSTQIAGVDDAREWEATLGAMRLLKMDGTEMSQVYRILAAILHLGNVTFEPSGNTDFAKVCESEPVEIAAELFGVPAAEFERGLLNRDISNKMERVIQRHNVREANESRDALAKHTYSRLFNFLTGCINRALSSRLDEVNGNDVRTISVLDIFGFESFGINSFEQLCINYCNEKLQGFFNNHVFKLEQEEYRREELDISAIGFSDNAGVIATIDDRATGVFAICDDEVNLLRGTDDGFLAKVIAQAKTAAKKAAAAGKASKEEAPREAAAPPEAPPAKDNSQRKSALRKNSFTAAATGLASAVANATMRKREGSFVFLTKGNALDDKVFLKEPDVKEMRKNEASRASFIVVHFAGEVMYNTEGFLEKNRDILRRDLLQVVQASKSRLVQQLFQEETEDIPVSDKHKSKVKAALYRKTLSRKFQEQLDALMFRLNTTEPHFVRTIKPNSVKKPLVFEAPLALDQLRYAGLLEVCRIRQLGYPARKDFAEFFRLFCCLHPEARDVHELLELLKRDGVLSGMEWQKGKTKVFMRAGVYDDLCKGRERALWDVTVLLQRNIRRWLARNRFLRTKSAFKDLERGIANRDRALLERTIPFAAALPNAGRSANAALIDKARRVLDEIKEEAKLMEQLAEAVRAKDIGTLPSLIAAAEKAGLGARPEVLEARELVKRAAEEKRALEALAAAIQGRRVPELRAAVAAADKLGLSQHGDCRTARALLQRLEEEEKLLAELEEAIKAKDLDRIDTLVQALVNLGARDHPTVQKAQKLVKRIIKESEERRANLERIDADLRAAIEARDLAALQALRVRIEELGHKGALVDEAMELRRHLEARLSLLQRLAVEVQVLATKARSLDGIAEKDLGPLAAVLGECTKQGLSDDKEPEVRNASAFLRRMKRQLEVQDMLEQALEDNMYSSLLKALLAAQALGMETANARRVAEEVRNLEKIKMKLDKLDEAKRREKRLGLLRYSTPEEQEQLEGERLDHMNQPAFIKQLEEIEGVAKFELQNYYRIRDDDDYTEPFPYQERAGQAVLKLFSTRSPIPKSVHEVDDLQNELALRMHRNLLMYCGDMPATHTAGNAQWIVIHGLIDARLADEAYIQLLKHLRGNQSKSSEDKAWLVLCMCTKYFPPSETFAPYVLHFCVEHRNYPSLVGNYARLCLAQLGSTMELGPSKCKPSLEELESYSRRPPVLCLINIPDGSVVTLPVSPEMRLDTVTKLVRQATGILDAVKKQAWAVFCKDTGETNNDGLRDRLVRFYKLYNPAKLPAIEVYVQHWQGREKELFARLVEQYGPEPAYAQAPQRDKGRAGLALPVTVALAAGKMLRGVQSASRSGPSPQIAWPLPMWVHPGDVYLRMAQQKREPTFVFKRRVLPSKGKADLLLYQQLRMDFIAGSLVVGGEQDVAELAAIALTLADPKVNLDDDAKLAKIVGGELSRSWLEDKTATQWAKLLGAVDLPQPGGDANLRQRYCDILKKSPSYGMSLYHAERSDSHNVYVIGVDQYGIHVLNPELDSLLRSFPHTAIKKYGAVAGAFWMKVAKSKLEKEGSLAARVSKRFGGKVPTDITTTSAGLAKDGMFDFLKRNDGIDVVLNTIQSWELFDALFLVQQVLKEKEDKEGKA